MNKISKALLCMTVIIAVFALGLYLGGKIIYSKYLQEVQELRQELNENQNSVIVIQPEITQKTEFKPRDKWDHSFKIALDTKSFQEEKVFFGIRVNVLHFIFIGIFISGLFIGCWAGVVSMCMLIISKKRDTVKHENS